MVASFRKSHHDDLSCDTASRRFRLWFSSGVIAIVVRDSVLAG